jgi:hypothetical protein
LQSARLNIRIFNPRLSPEYKDSESSPLQGIGGRATTLSPPFHSKKGSQYFASLNICAIFATRFSKETEKEWQEE